MKHQLIRQQVLIYFANYWHNRLDFELLGVDAKYVRFTAAYIFACFLQKTSARHLIRSWLMQHAFVLVGCRFMLKLRHEQAHREPFGQTFCSLELERRSLYRCCFLEKQINLGKD